jgi:adenine-specific DNA-methyltransferase
MEHKYGLTWEIKTDTALTNLQNNTVNLKENTELQINDNVLMHHLVNGDNLYGLQALLDVKQSFDVIYIDPPYNTGSKDFIYNDTYVDIKDDYRHSEWLSFMSSRLTIAQTLLNDTGTILVSIDDNEQANLKLLMDQIFGAKNYIATLIWQGGRKNDSKFVSVSHDYILIYAKNKENLSKTKWRATKPEAEIIIKTSKSIYMTELAKHSKINSEIKKYFDTQYEVWLDNTKNLPLEWWHQNLFEVAAESTRLIKQWFKTQPNNSEIHNSKHFNNIDEKGKIFYPENISWPGGGGPQYVIYHPVTHQPVPIPGRGWIYNERKMLEEIEKGNIYFRSDHTQGINRKSYLEHVNKTVLDSVFYKDRRSSNLLLQNILGKNKFDFPKDVEVIKTWIKYVSNGKKDIKVLDFFAGSGTTGQAVIELNAEDEGSRVCFLITDEGKITNDEIKSVTINIAKEVTYERLKRVITGKNWADNKTHPSFNQGLKYYEIFLIPKVK